MTYPDESGEHGMHDRDAPCGPAACTFFVPVLEQVSAHHVWSAPGALVLDAQRPLEWGRARWSACTVGANCSPVCVEHGVVAAYALTCGGCRPLDVRNLMIGTRSGSSYLAANRADLALSGPNLGLTAPAFVAPSGDHAPCACGVVLRLLVTNLWEMPDLAAAAAFMASGRRLAGDLEQRDCQCCVEAMRRRATTMEPHAGLAFPTTIQGPRGRVSCAVTLERRGPRWPWMPRNRWPARLWMLDRVDAIPAGTVLARTARWHEAGEWREISTAIATVVEAGTPAPL